MSGDDELDILDELWEKLKMDQERGVDDRSLHLRTMLLKVEFENVIEQGDPKDEADKKMIYWAFVTQGNELLKQARQSNNDALYRDSIKKYVRAV
jgi:hypothetical protein